MPNPISKTLELYLGAVEDSSSRTRWITVVLTVASIVTFFSYWNTLPHSWLLSRTRLAQRALELAVLPDSSWGSLAIQHDQDQRHAYQAATEYLDQRNILENSLRVQVPFALKPSPVTSPQSLYGPSPISFPNTEGLEYTGSLGLDLRTLEVIHDFMTFREATIDEIFVLDIPFLGIRFDVNDLGLMAGLAFAIILMLRLMSLNNERDALRLTVERARREECLLDVYQIISMKQVLTLPIRHAYADVMGMKQLWVQRALLMAIDFAAPIILLCVFQSNWSSYEVGHMISPENAKISIATSLALCVLAFFLTVLSLLTDIGIYKLLDASAREGGAAGP